MTILLPRNTIEDETTLKLAPYEKPCALEAQFADKVNPPEAGCRRSSDAPSPGEPTIEELKAGEPTATVVVDLLLKNRDRLDLLMRDETQQRLLIPRLLGIALVGFAIYGVVATIVLNGLASTYGVWWSWVPEARWRNASVANLSLAYTIGLIAANGVCLPSFYFYGLLAGVRTTMLGVVTQALKGMAAGAIALVGILPVYMAIALSALVFTVPPQVVEIFVMLGLILPFLAGIWGANSLYEGFVRLADTMSPVERCTRECFLRRLIFAWCGCYTCVTPLMIYTLWVHLAALQGG